MTLKPNSKEALALLQETAEKIIAPMGYELVALEQTKSPDTLGGRTLVLYIDFLNTEAQPTRRISLEDCVAVNKAIDELFESTELLDGHYSLEVSSPGVERPLRRQNDFNRFQGRKARIHTFRALDAEEIENAQYWETHKKQKNFIGVLQGLDADKDKIKISTEGSLVHIPFALVSKANLEFEDINS